MFFRERGMFLLDSMFDYHPVHLMALSLNSRTRKMKQCTNNQRNSCIGYIKEEMILFDAADDRTLRIMQHYYDEEEDDLPTSTIAIHQMEIDNYLKFRVDKSKQSDASADCLAYEPEYNPLHFWRQNHSLHPHFVDIVFIFLYMVKFSSLFVFFL